MEFPRKLKVAQNVKEIVDSFDAAALSTEEDMRDFYVETMDARTGDPYDSPIETLEEACRNPRERGAMLLLGHRGCGKSTELNKMRQNLEKEGRFIITIQCEERIVLENHPRFSDLLILMGEELYKLAVETGVNVESDTWKRLRDFWTPVMLTRERGIEEAIETEANVKIGTPEWFKAILGEIFVQLKSDVKFNDEVRAKSEEQIRINFAEWRTLIRRLSNGISDKTRKQPVLIFEGLDHLEDQEDAGKLFFEHADKLTDVSFPVIYTFPIALYYDARFKPFEDQFRESLVFPMLKLETVDGEPCPEGRERLKMIVGKRVRDGLIQPEALDLMIEKTGGSLRDLFRVIREAAQRATNRSKRTSNPNEILKLEDAERALTKVQSDLTRRIEGDEHLFLAKICVGNKREIKETAMLLKMLQARTVLEYNGKRWHNVHPLVADYLEELGYIERKEGRGWKAGERMRSMESN